MSTKEVANALVSLCQQGKFMEAIEKYYADNIVSVEPKEHPGMQRRMEGIDAVKGKNQWWAENHEVHEIKVNGPFVSEDSDQFGVFFQMDVTSKPQNQRIQASEMGVYTVKDDKVVHEEFYYNAQEMPEG